MNRTLVSFIIIAVFVVGGLVAYRQAPISPTGAAAQTATDQQVPTTGAGNTVSAEGFIVPSQYANLSFEMGGQIESILVKEGDSITAGDPLVRLEGTQLAIEIRQAEGELARSEANLAAAEARLASAQAGVAVAEMGVGAAQAQLALAQADPRPEEIAAVESNLLTASAAINQAVANRDASLELPDSQVRAAEARLAAAVAEERAIQEQYDVVIRNGIGGPQEEQLRFALNAAQANVNAAQTALNELNEGRSESERRLAGSAISIASAQRDAAQAQLDLLLARPKSEEIVIYEVSVQQAEAAVVQAKSLVAEAEAAILQAQATVLQAQAAVDAVLAARDRLTLTAPSEGTVASLPVKIGETVSAGAPIATVANLNDWLVETQDLSELDVASVTIGAPVALSIDALPGQTFSGTVSHIDLVSTMARGDVTYTVIISLNDNAPLRWGMTAFVEFGE